jgi:hypothetical protein
MGSEVIALFATLAQAQEYCISTEALQKIVADAVTKPPAVAPDCQTGIARLKDIDLEPKYCSFTIHACLCPFARDLAI